MNRRSCTLALAAVAAVVGCGSDGESETVTVIQTQPAPPPPATTPAQPQQEGSPKGSDCGVQGGLRIEIVLGQVPCDEALGVAAGYDTSGGAVQNVGTWTCAGGNAQTAPIVFTCTLGDKEFTASLAGE